MAPGRLHHRLGRRLTLGVVSAGLVTSYLFICVCVSLVKCLFCFHWTTVLR